MFNSVNVSIRLLAEYAADRGLLALRWGLDVVRGYQRVADGYEGIRHCLRHAREGHAEDALRWLRHIETEREQQGPLGVGARLAMTPAEFVDLRVAAENLRSEALRREQNTGAQA